MKIYIIMYVTSQFCYIFDEMEEIIKIVESLEDSCLLLKGVSETIQNQAKEQKERFISLLVGD